MEKNMDRTLFMEKEQTLRACILDCFAGYIHELEINDEPDREIVELSDEEVERMSDKLVLLPHEARCILFGEYCFDMAFDDMREMYELTDPKGLSVWYKRMLSNLAGLSKEQIIADASLKRISDAALEKYTALAEKRANDESPTKASMKPQKMVVRFVKYVAAAAAVLAIGFTSMMTVNAEFREKVVNWVAETFVEFSIFNSSSEMELSMEDLLKHTPEYIPDKYEYIDKVEMGDGVTYMYADNTGSALSIFITIPGDGWMVDTEGMDVRETVYDGNDAYYYYGDGEARFIFSKDGYPMYILGDLDFEECIEIANGIK